MIFPNNLNHTAVAMATIKKQTKTKTLNGSLIKQK